MAISPQRMAEIQAMIQAQGTPAPTTGGMTAQRRAEIEAMIKQQQQPQQEGTPGILGVISGWLKRRVDTPRQFAESGQSIGRALSQSGPGQFIAENITKPLINLLPEQVQQNIAKAASAARRASDVSTTQSEALKLRGTAENIGGTISDVGMFFMPGGAVARGARALEGTAALSKLGKFAAPVARGLAEGTASTAIAAGQTGSLAEAGKAGLADLALTTGLGALGRGVSAIRAGRVANVTEDIATAPKTNIFARGTEYAQGRVRSIPERLMNNILRPPSKAFNFGKNPGRTVAELGIVGNSEEELLTNIARARQEVGQQIGNIVSKIDPTPNIEFVDVIKPLDDAISEASKFKRTNQPLITRLQSLKDDLVDTVGGNTGRISAQQAFDLKREIGAMSKWTGQAFDSELNQARVGVYQNLKKAIEDASKKLIIEGPSLRKFNETFGNLVEAESALQNRIGVSQRNNMIGLGDIGYAGVGGLTFGGLGAATLFFLKKGLGTTAMQTRVAVKLESIMKALDKPSKQALDGYLPTIAGKLETMPERQRMEFIDTLPTLAKLIRMGILGVPNDETSSQMETTQGVPQAPLSKVLK